jgi:hypothetical protein
LYKNIVVRKQEIFELNNEIIQNKTQKAHKIVKNL